jgi:hypothetical protein
LNCMAIFKRVNFTYLTPACQAVKTLPRLRPVDPATR